MALRKRFIRSDYKPRERPRDALGAVRPAGGGQQVRSRKARVHAPDEYRGPTAGYTNQTRWRRLRRRMDECDLIVEVVDARNIYATRLPLVEYWAGLERLLIVANKADLLPVFPKDDRVLFISCRAQNAKAEREKLIHAILAKRPHVRPLRVLVIGFPNTGKSSVINLLAARHAASTGEKAGVTTNIQWIRIHQDVLLVDTPGVFPESEEKAALVARGAVNIDGLIDKEIVACQLLESALAIPERRAWLEKYFDVKLEGESPDDPELFLEAVARRRGWLKKGGAPSTAEAAKVVLRAMFSDAPFMASVPRGLSRGY